MRASFRRAPKKRSRLGQLTLYAPVALELLSLWRGYQKKKRGKFAPRRKRDRALDFLLERAVQRVGGKRKRRGLF